MHHASATALAPRVCTLVPFINPRRACAARVTVVVLSFCLSVCLSVVVLSFCLSVCLSVTTFSAATSNKTANKRYEWVQCHTGCILKIAFFCKNAAFESYGVKQSEEANMQIGTGLPRPPLRRPASNMPAYFSSIIGT